MIEIYRKSFDYMRKNFAESVLFGVSALLLGGVFTILPILGAIILSYFYPNLIAWYYTKVTGEDINPDYKTAFKALLIPTLLMSIGMMLIQYSGSYLIKVEYTDSMGYQYYGPDNPILAIAGVIILIIAAIVGTLLLYTFYGAILGKVNKLSIHFSKSLKLFAYILVCLIILTLLWTAIFVIYILYTLMVSPNITVVSMAIETTVAIDTILLTILFSIFVESMVNLVALLKAKEI
jgi:MFS family permease